MEQIKFNNTTQEIIFRYFFQFLGTLQIPLLIDVIDNKAYIRKEGEVARMMVFPYNNDGLHFEFSRNLQKPFNTKDTIPVFVNTVAELELIKPATKVIFFSTEAAPETKGASKGPSKDESIVSKENESSHTIKEFAKNVSRETTIKNKKSDQKTIRKFF